MVEQSAPIDNNKKFDLNSTLFLKKIASKWCSVCSTYARFGMIQRKLAWHLHKDDMQICKTFCIWKKKIITCKWIMVLNEKHKTIKLLGK